MQSLAKERRIGKILVSGPFVYDCTGILAEVFHKIKAVVLQLEHHFDADIFEYTLYSPLFDIIDTGSFAPKYELNVTTHYDVNGDTLYFDVEPRKLGWNYHQPYNPTNMEIMLRENIHKKESS